MSELIARLESLSVADAPGDWRDVVTRAERRRSRTVRRRLIVALAAALLVVPAIAIATRYWDPLSLTTSEEEVPLPQGESTLGYVIGDRLQLPGRPPARLGAALLAPYVHPETHLVVSSPDRSKVVYHSWVGELASRRRGPRGTPVLRLFDSATGRDVILARGAHSPAWRADETLAYTRAGTTDAKPRGVVRMDDGHIVVRRTLDRPPVRWSTFASRWSGLAWAGPYLLAQATVTRRDERFDIDFVDYRVHAFSGPGRSRVLPLGELIAISPDGRYAFGQASTHGGQGSDSLLRVVEVSSGKIVDELVQDSGAGAWARDTIILMTGFVSEPIPPGPDGLSVLPGPTYVKVVVLRYSDGKLGLERELRLSRDIVEATGLRASNFYFGFAAPAFVDNAARQFTVELVIHNTLKSRQIDTKVVYLTCDRIESRCRRGRSLDPRRFRSSALVSNPSRPLPD